MVASGRYPHEANAASADTCKQTKKKDHFVILAILTQGLSDNHDAFCLAQSQLWTLTCCIDWLKILCRGKLSSDNETVRAGWSSVDRLSGVWTLGRGTDLWKQTIENRTEESRLWEIWQILGTIMEIPLRLERRRWCWHVSCISRIRISTSKYGRMSNAWTVPI